MNQNHIRQVPKVAFVVLFVFITSCLNPINFDPDSLPLLKVEVSGEVSIDNINSAELRFVNHTKSMNIIKVDIERQKVGQSFELDSQISGGPYTGTSETMLVRPIGSSVSTSNMTEAYKVTIDYEKAAQSTLTDAELALLDLTPGELNLAFSRSEPLPRGKHIVHFYRDKASGQLSVSTKDPEVDNLDYIDYISNIDIKNNFMVSLGDLEVVLDPSTLQKIEVDFSAEVKGLIANLHIPLEDLSFVLSNMNTNLASISDVLTALKDIFSEYHIKSGQILATNEGYLYIHNLTDKAISNIQIGSIYETTIGANAEKGGVLRIGNYHVFFDEIDVTTTYVNHQEPHHLYYYLTVNGDYQWTTVWPPLNTSAPEQNDVTGTIRIENNATNATINEVRVYNVANANEYFSYSPGQYQFTITSTQGFVIGKTSLFRTKLIVTKGGNHFEVDKALTPDGILYNVTRTVTLEDADLVVPPPVNPAFFVLKINVVEPSDDSLVQIAIREADRPSVTDGRTGIRFAEATNSLTYKDYFMKHISPPMTSYISLGKIAKGQSTSVILPWPTKDGYDVFFIEGDGRTRGYSLSGKTSPSKEDNYIFYIKAGTAEINYATKTNFSSIK
jgi:hypothetical protein